LLLCVWNSVAQTPPPGYNWPPQGCPWEMLNCVHGVFDSNNCQMWINETNWDELFSCDCEPGWMGDDCSIPDQMQSCNGSELSNNFIPPTPAQCWLDAKGQSFLDLEDHHVDVNMVSAGEDSFNMTITVFSRVHNHSHAPPWGPVIPVLWCNADNCSYVADGDKVAYSCTELSCAACTLEQGCNAILAETAKLSTASPRDPATVAVTNVSNGQGNIDIDLNIFALALQCVTGQCAGNFNPNAPVISEDFTAGIISTVLPTNGGEMQQVAGAMVRNSTLQAELMIINATTVLVSVLSLFADHVQAVYIASLQQCSVTSLSDAWGPMFGWTAYSTSLGTQVVNGQPTSVWSLNSTVALTLNAIGSPIPSVPVRFIEGIPQAQVVSFIEFFDWNPVSNEPGVFTLPPYCDQDHPTLSPSATVLVNKLRKFLW